MFDKVTAFARSESIGALIQDLLDFDAKAVLGTSVGFPGWVQIAKLLDPT